VTCFPHTHRDRQEAPSTQRFAEESIYHIPYTIYQLAQGGLKTKTLRKTDSLGESGPEKNRRKTERRKGRSHQGGREQMQGGDRGGKRKTLRATKGCCPAGSSGPEMDTIHPEGPQCHH
jgi:hypothetical protein